VSTADFSADPTTGPLPLTVNFSPVKDTPYRYWDLGDGTETHEQGAISHTYETNGKFTVTHTVGDDAEHTVAMTKDDYIKVEPYAEFACKKAATWQCSGDLTICPIAICKSHSGGEALTYHWDFGDGHTSNEKDPTHQYNAFTIYGITLTVTDGAGLTDSQTHFYDWSTVEEPVRLYLPVITN
jgi:PKD repeat protein